jgi:hypothetical protein
MSGGAKVVKVRIILDCFSKNNSGGMVVAKKVAAVFDVFPDHFSAGRLFCGHETSVTKIGLSVSKAETLSWN